jgi:hypothetical protein
MQEIASAIMLFRTGADLIFISPLGWFSAAGPYRRTFTYTYNKRVKFLCHSGELGRTEQLVGQ